jgi:hypothetical protein
MLRLVKLVTFAVCLFPAITPSAPGQSANPNGLSAEQRQLADLKSTRNDISISANVNNPDATYRVGEALKLTVTASEDVFLTILNVGGSGRTTVLVPNGHEKLVSAPAGRAIPIPTGDAPYVIRVGGPSGFELIKIIATKEPIDLLAGRGSQLEGPFRSLEAPAGMIARGLESDLLGQLKQGYAVADIVIRVVDNAPKK